MTTSSILLFNWASIAFYFLGKGHQCTHNIPSLRSIQFTKFRSFFLELKICSFQN